jgi:hypothetical protein
MIIAMDWTFVIAQWAAFGVIYLAITIAVRSRG